MNIFRFPISRYLSYNCSHRFSFSTQNGPNPIKNQQFSVFIGNLSFNSREEDIYQLIEPYGTPSNIDFIKNSKGFFMGAVFIHFSNEKQAKSCLELNEKIHMSRPLQVNMSDDQNAKEKHNELKEKKANHAVCINNLPFHRSESEIKEIFSVCGKIEKISFPKNTDGKYLTYGFIHFSNTKSTELALKMNRIYYKDRKVTIKPAKIY